jgi:carboxymethylenebutenolidase
MKTSLPLHSDTSTSKSRIQSRFSASLRRLCPGLALVLALIEGPFLQGQDWAKERIEKSPRHLEWVQVKHGDREVKCFIAYPEVADKATTVVVIHEIFGLTDWVRGVTDQLAAAGYIAIAPDLLSGSAANGGGTAELGSSDAARQAISVLKPDQITADLQAVVNYVKALPASNGKVAVGGFCWGGSQTFRFATNSKDIVAAFPFYGSGPDQLDDLQRVQVPVYGFYGSNDARVNATIPKSVELMKEAGKTYEPVIYEGAGHGFMRAGEAPDASEANREGRAKAWVRWKELLEAL